MDVAPSVLEQVLVVDRRGPAGSEDGHHDAQAHHDLGGRDHHDEEGEDLPGQIAVEAI